MKENFKTTFASEKEFRNMVYDSDQRFNFFRAQGLDHKKDLEQLETTI